MGIGYVHLLLTRTMRRAAVSDGANNAHTGTRAQAILELDYPRLSVFSPNYYGRISEGAHSPEVNDIAKYWLDQLPSDAQQFVIEGAAGDTASVGVAFVNAGLNPNGTDGAVFDTFAARETDWLLTAIPRMDNGAISHRPPHEPAQVWADNFYMSPPYLAYYGIATKNISVAKEAFTQIAAMRDILRDPETGLLMHVIGGHWEDRKLWGTGIAWAIAGISRVYATYLYSPFTGTFDRERNQLAQWANELVAAVLPYIVSPVSALRPDRVRAELALRLPYSPTRACFPIPMAGTAALTILPAQRSSQHPSTAWLSLASSTMMSRRLRRPSASARASMPRSIASEDGECTRSLAPPTESNRRLTASPSSHRVASCADPLEFYTVSNESPESLAFIMLLDASVNSYKAITSPNQKGSSLLELKANLTVVADRPVEQV